MGCPSQANKAANLQMSSHAVSVLNQRVFEHPCMVYKSYTVDIPKGWVFKHLCMGSELVHTVLVLQKAECSSIPAGVSSRFACTELVRVFSWCHLGTMVECCQSPGPQNWSPGLPKSPLPAALVWLIPSLLVLSCPESWERTAVAALEITSYFSWLLTVLLFKAWVVLSLDLEARYKMTWLLHVFGIAQLIILCLTAST